MADTPEPATSTIVLRVTRSRKAAYVRAAHPQTLAAWMFEQCDKAATAKEYGGKCLRCCGVGYFGLDSTCRACGGTGRASG